MANINLSGNGIGARKSSPFPTVLLDGNTVAWYDYLKGTTLVTGVSQWNDQSGNGNNLLQAQIGDQPRLSVQGITFDGVSDYLKTAAFTLVQPESIYIVVKQVSWTNGRYFFDGETDADGIIWQKDSSPNLKAYAGTNSSENVNLQIGRFGIIRVIFNGASSKFQINETTAIEENLGSIGLGGLTLGSKGLTGANSNIAVKEWIVRKVADSEINYNAIYNYLKNKYNIPELVNLGIIGDSISTPITGLWTNNIPPKIYNSNNEAAPSETIISHMSNQTTRAIIDNNEIIILALGTNDDNGGDMAALQAEVESNISALKSANPSAVIYYMNVLPRWTNPSGTTIVDKSNIRTAITAACAAQSIACWDTFTDPWIEASDTQDGTHPTSSGGIKIWNEIASRI